jgi:hypothetical protein
MKTQNLDLEKKAIHVASESIKIEEKEKLKEKENIKAVCNLSWNEQKKIKEAASIIEVSFN